MEIIELTEKQWEALQHLDRANKRLELAKKGRIGLNKNYCRGAVNWWGGRVIETGAYEVLLTYQRILWERQGREPEWSKN